MPEFRVHAIQHYYLTIEAEDKEAAMDKMDNTDYEGTAYSHTDYEAREIE